MGPPERPHGPGTPWGSARPQATPTPKVIQWSAYFFTFFSHFAHHPQNHTTKRLYVSYLSSTQICNPGPQLPGILSHYFHIFFILFSYFFILFSHFGGHTVAGLFFHICFIFPRAFFSHFWGHPKNHPGGGLCFFTFFSHFTRTPPPSPPHPPRARQHESGPGCATRPGLGRDRVGWAGVGWGGPARAEPQGARARGRGHGPTGPVQEGPAAANPPSRVGINDARDEPARQYMAERPPPTIVSITPRIASTPPRSDHIPTQCLPGCPNKRKPQPRAHQPVGHHRNNSDAKTKTENTPQPNRNMHRYQRKTTSTGRHIHAPTTDGEPETNTTRPTQPYTRLSNN